MAQRFAKPAIQTSVNVSPEFYQLCKQHRIKFSEAMRVGIAIILAEKGVAEYDNTLNISKRVDELKQKAAMYAQEAANLKEATNGN